MRQAAPVAQAAAQWRRTPDRTRFDGASPGLPMAAPAGGALVLEPSRECGDHRIRPLVPCAGVHTPDTRIILGGIAPDAADEESGASGARPRGHRADQRDRAARAARAAQRSVYPGHSRRTLQAGRVAPRARIEDRGRSAVVRAAACRGLWTPRGTRLISTDADRSAHGAARF